MTTARRLSRVWAALLAIGGAAALQAQTYNIADYFPLFPNSHWRMVDVENPSTGDTDAFVWNVLGTGTQTVGSYSVWKVRTTCDEPTDARHLDEDFWNYYGGGTNPKLGLYGVYKGTAVTGVPGNQTVLMSAPLQMGGANMAVGWTTTSSATASVRTDFGTFPGTFAATPLLEAHLESLTTPLGVFNDVIRLKITVTVTVTVPFVGNRTFEFLGSRFWLARGIGLVRQNQTADPDDAVYQVLEEGTLNGNPITPTGAVTHSVSFVAGTGGSLVGTTPQTIAHGGNATAVSANATTGYRFVRWTSGGSLFSTNNPLTVTNVTTELTLTAVFAPDHTVAYAAGLHGSITGTATQIVADGGSTTAVTASADGGYHFVQWSDGSTTNPRQDTNVTSDIAVTASFTANVVVTEVQVLPDTLAVACLVGTSPAAATFSVRNGLEGTISYTVSESISWLSVSPTSGSSSGEWDTITVTFSTAALPAGAYVGTITVTSGSSVKTVQVSLNVTDVLIERSFPAGCLAPGDSVDVSVTMDFGDIGVLTSLAIYETLPAGWQFEGVLSSPEPDIVPGLGATGTLQFSWLGIPAFPHTLTYRVSVPGGAAHGTYCFTGTVAYRTGGPETILPTNGDNCIEVGNCCVPHQADQNGDWRINLTPELTRLIQFYNLRRYHCQGGTEDGYGPGVGATSCSPHQADQNGDWVIQLSPELTRLIQFYNSDGYHCEEGTEDGYAPGLARRKAAADPGTLGAERHVTAAAGGDGRTLEVTITLAHTDPGAVTSLSVQETLPPGWVFSGVLSKSAPSLQPSLGATGTLDFAWIRIPAQWPVTLTYRLSLPATALGGDLLAGSASYRAAAGEITVTTPADTLTTSFQTAIPVDPDGSFVAVLDAAAAGAGHGIWDLTGTYSTSVAGNLLTLDLAHDTTGRLSGSATLSINTGKDVIPVTLPVRGSTKGLGEALLITVGMRGTAASGRASATLAFNLTLNTANRQLVGPVTGAIEADGVTLPVAETATLSIPPPMDGTWTLRFELTPAGTGVTGTATLALSNGVQHRYALRGRLSGQTVLASLTGLGDPAAKSIRTAITPLAGGGARLNALAGKCYGQSILLSR